MRDFVATFTDAADFHTEPSEVSAMTPRGTLSVMTAKRFTVAFGGPLPEAAPRLQAIRFAVQDVAQARRALRGISHRDYRDGFVVDAADAMGAVLSFEPSQNEDTDLGR